MESPSGKIMQGESTGQGARFVEALAALLLSLLLSLLLVLLALPNSLLALE